MDNPSGGEQQCRLCERLLALRRAESAGNTEGTPTRARASMPGHLCSADSSNFRDFFGRRGPRLPAVPASSLHGKEGVVGSSPTEGFAETPANRSLRLSAL
jgi:hypothetical protein